MDILFPRLSGALVASLNKQYKHFPALKPISEEDIAKTTTHKAMLFEIAVAYAELLIGSDNQASWEVAVEVAARRQRRHYNAKVPTSWTKTDVDIATHAATNLVYMLKWLQTEIPGSHVVSEPSIPGMGWIASGKGDFSIGKTLIEVKHTDRNFMSRDFKQVLMYWLLNYAYTIENDGVSWTHLIMLNPRRNIILQLEFDTLLISASSNSNRVELSEQLRAIVNSNPDWN
ncbi:MAG: hypothetical protein RIG26_18450 [Thalassospira sp.]|uniref:hypothetical protein n=1 Tax=Thalassospira sp. TaxID=1912094 RepID=UPI0032EF8571